MQRIYTAIALALTLSVVSAGFSASDWVKAPIQVIQDTETDFTNRSNAAPTLANTNPGELSIASVYTNLTNPPSNTSAWSWNAVWKKLDTKALTTSNNGTLTWTQPLFPAFTMGYAVVVTTEQDSSNNVSYIRVYQQPLAGGAALARIQIPNTNTNYTPKVVGGASIGKNVYIFYNVADKKVNFTSFTIGGAAASTEYTLGSAIETGSLAITWGEALGSGQVLAYWLEGTTAKDALVDLSKGTATANAVTNYNVNITCFPYSTDKKIYGEVCLGFDTNMTQLKTFIKTNSTGINPWSSYQLNITGFESVQPYGEYLLVFFNNGTRVGARTLSYELWDLATLQTKTARKTYLTVDGPTVYSMFRVPAGGIYGLFYNMGNGANNTVMYQTVSVGQIMSASYLTTILGFFMTIVAGLFLF